MLNISFQKIKDYVFTISEGALGLGVVLAIMIMVERAQGEAALGTFSYLLSLYFIIGFLSQFGIPKYIESQVALDEIKSPGNYLFINAFQTLFIISIVCTLIIFLSAVYDTGITRVAEGVAGYLIIGLAIPVRNLNELRLAFLQGSGEHEAAFKLRLRKRIVLVVAIYFLLVFRVPHSWLILCFLISELSIVKEWKAFGNVRKILKKKYNIKATLRHGSDYLFIDEALDVFLYLDFRATLRHGSDYLFIDEALDVFLYLDFLILGFFITSKGLGVYAEASILARFFLLIPVSIKPVIRHRYCELAGSKNDILTSLSVHRTTVVLFFIHSVLALYFLLYYPAILHNLFNAWGYENTSFRIFTVLLPGLLFFSVVTAQEPLYEAQGKTFLSQNIVVTVSVINLCLNLYLIPFAGFLGAAYATVISMFVYFFLFGRKLFQVFRINKIQYLVAGAGVYLVYMIFQRLDLNFIITFWLVPVVLFALLCLMGFFKHTS